VFAKRLRHPVPVSGMIEAAVDEDKGRVAVLSVIPELQLQAIRIKEVRDRLHDGALYTAALSVRRFRCTRKT
jgi:PIN domain nuclease of toxin-antitoxin system